MSGGLCRWHFLGGCRRLCVVVNVGLVKGRTNYFLRSLVMKKKCGLLMVVVACCCLAGCQTGGTNGRGKTEVVIRKEIEVLKEEREEILDKGFLLAKELVRAEIDLAILRACVEGDKLELSKKQSMKDEKNGLHPFLEKMAEAEIALLIMGIETSAVKIEVMRELMIPNLHGQIKSLNLDARKRQEGMDALMQMLYELDGVGRH